MIVEAIAPEALFMMCLVPLVTFSLGPVLMVAVSKHHVRAKDFRLLTDGWPATLAELRMHHFAQVKDNRTAARIVHLDIPMMRVFAVVLIACLGWSVSQIFATTYSYMPLALSAVLALGVFGTERGIKENVDYFTARPAPASAQPVAVPSTSKKRNTGTPGST